MTTIGEEKENTQDAAIASQEPMSDWLLRSIDLHGFVGRN